KAVPEVFASRYDIRYLLNGMVALSDGEKPHLPLSPLQKMKVAKLIKGTDIEEMLKEFNII
ncbi:MAG: oleate hydratase, partial [Peptoniphilus harei]|nr:oleate hydratase [Peptoniphilus harei]